MQPLLFFPLPLAFYPLDLVFLPFYGCGVIFRRVGAVKGAFWLDFPEMGSIFDGTVLKNPAR